jgi:hypothetical protein
MHQQQQASRAWVVGVNHPLLQHLLLHLPQAVLPLLPVLQHLLEGHSHIPDPPHLLVQLVLLLGRV